MDTESMTQRIPPKAVADLVSMAWETFIGTELTAIDAFAGWGQSPIMCASIAIGGPWSATVVLSFSRTIAFSSTSSVLGIPLDELDEADVRDIIGELANIVGGNVKGFVSDEQSDWSLSLPVVSDGMLSVPGSRLATELLFLCDDQPIGCQIREHA